MSKSVLKTESLEVTVEELKKHNKRGDFWTVIENNVYDLSNFEHPGGTIIYIGAGSDSTVMFNHYHIANFDKASTVLKKYRIGVMKDAKSPVMGDFYIELRKRVGDTLKELPRYPLLGQFLFFFDIFVMIAAVTWSIYLGNCTVLNPYLMFIAVFLVDIFNIRVSGQCHALGHMQIFGAPMVNYLEVLLTLVGRTQNVYTLPNPDIPFRSLLNEPRSKSEFEFWVGDYRGPFEHQGIHHVKGAELEHDACKDLASLNTLVRLAEGDRYVPWIHTWQRSDIARNLLLTFAENMFTAAGGILTLQHSIQMFKLGDVYRGVLNLIGFFAEVAKFIANIYTPFSTGCVPLIVALVLYRRFFGLYLLFFAQHKWDYVVSEEQSNTNWGYYNCTSSISLWGKEMWWHPVLLFYTDGACPATLTYHNEHTLFPGTCYLYLSKVAVICEEVAKKYNVPYNRIDGYGGLTKSHADHIAKYSYPPLNPTGKNKKVN